MEKDNRMHNRQLPFLSALLISVSAALADPQGNTNGFSNSASSLIQKISLNIEALQPRFTELADFSAATNSVTRIDYRRNVDYVAKIPKCNSYYHVKVV